MPPGYRRRVITPRNCIVVLLDSLNRHLIGPYGGREFSTPNLDRIAARSVRFDNHYVGGIPCMPARHDILVGTLDFLWRPWGSIEVWERPVTAALRDAGVASVLVADHPHLFEIGGENYHCEFTAWEYLRGSETDHWKSRRDDSWVGAPNSNLTDWIRTMLQVREDFVHPYDRSRGWFTDESDFPGPRTMTAAARWIDEHSRHHDRFFLFVDEFDPHEPFDTPEPWASMYDDWDVATDGPRLVWPPYAKDVVASGYLTEREAAHTRANYGSKLSMIDHWLGKLLDAIDRRQLWDDTAVIVCTDHGLFLGERDIWGKPSLPFFEPFGHTPLLVSWPGVEPGVRTALTTNVDIHATIRDIFDATSHAYRLHGSSIAPLLDGSATSIRDWALMGIWGCEVQITDGRHKYVRAPTEENRPLSMWSNRWSSITPYNSEVARLPNPDRRAFLDYMPATDCPVIRQPYAPGDAISMFAMASQNRETLLFDVVDDPHEQENLVGSPVERELVDLLRTALTELDAPEDHFARLGI
jgi:arylsulfatase A-like enzyme